MKKPRKQSKRTTVKQVQATEDKPFVMPTVAVKPDTDDGPIEHDGLSIRQRSFVEAITGPAYSNASKAAEIAGYASENRNALYVTASRLLSSAKIQEAIASALARKRPPEWAHERLLELAGASMRNFLSMDENGLPKLDWDKAFASGGIGQVREWREEALKLEGSPVEVIKRSFKLHDPAPALATLLKLSGQLIERHNVSVSTDLSNLPEDDLHRLRDILSRANGARPVDSGN